MTEDHVDEEDRNGGRRSSDRVAISAVVPCFNECLVIDELYRRLIAVLKQVAGDSHEMIMVNDGSTDQTWSLIRRLIREDPHVVGVDLSKNHGHQLAITAGLFHSRGDRVVGNDADLQDPPELICDMMQLMAREQADVVYGRRIRRMGETWFKRTSAHLFYAVLSRLSATDITRDVGDLRVMSARVVEILNSMAEQHRFLRGLVPWIGFKQVPFDYDRQQRAAGTTKYSKRRMARLALDALTSFSLAPLRMSIYVGFTAAVVALSLAAYAIVLTILGHTISGWASLIAVVLFMGGSQLVVTGVLGEYIGRIHEQTQNRPLFIVREVVRSEVRTARP